MDRQIQADNAFIKWMEAMSKNVVHIADAWYAAVKWADQHPNWISVEERLPEIPKNDWKSNNVLFVVNGEIFYGYHGKYTWHAPFVSFNNHEVTHWMEIIPPRKEANNE